MIKASPIKGLLFLFSGATGSFKIGGSCDFEGALTICPSSRKCKSAGDGADYEAKPNLHL